MNREGDRATTEEDGIVLNRTLIASNFIQISQLLVLRSRDGHVCKTIFSPFLCACICFCLAVDNSIFHFTKLEHKG